jgi:hypothetical protein
LCLLICELNTLCLYFSEMISPADDQPTQQDDQPSHRDDQPSQ